MGSVFEAAGPKTGKAGDVGFGEGKIDVRVDSGRGLVPADFRPDVEGRTRDVVVAVDQPPEQPQESLALLGRERLQNSLLSSFHRLIDGFQQGLASRRYMQEFDAPVFVRRTPLEPAFAFHAFEHVAERRSIDGYSGGEPCGVDSRMPRYLDKTGELHRRQILCGAFFHEDRHGNLMRAAYQMPRHRSKIARSRHQPSQRLRSPTLR